MSRPNPEALLISWGNSTGLLDAPFSVNVPTDRPERFFTVERTGGGSSFYQDRPLLAVQAWAPSRADASRLIYDFEQAAWNELQYHDQVARFTVNAIVNFPAANDQPRYQALIELVVA